MASLAELQPNLGGQAAPPVLTPEHFAIVQQVEEDIAEKKKKLVTDLVGMLVSKREQCIRARGEANKRMIDDQRQWFGETRLMNTKEFPSQNADDHARPPRPHLTRSRTDLWESRMIDLLAPTNDPTWDLKPLTLEDPGPEPGVDPGVWAQQAGLIRQDAKDRASKMRDVVKDQLAACGATGAMRKVCQDACRMGIGVLMGPLNSVHTIYGTDGQGVKIYETVVPKIEAGDVWCFYPEMVKSADKAEYAFYVHWMGQAELMTFAQNPGVDEDEIEELLEEAPVYGEIETVVKERNQRSGMVENIANRYPVWRFTGILDRKYLDALDIPKDQVKGRVFSADIWFSNSHILKAKISTLSAAGDFRIPYYVFTPFPIDETMFGASVPYLCRDSDRAAASAWIIMLQNASLSAGPQCIYRPGKIRPLDGKYSMRGPKMWQALDDGTDLNNLMSFIDVPNNSSNAMAVYEAAKQLLDEELNTQQWASSDTSDVMDAASGLAMLMNARTILQRRVCAAADDQVYRPMIQRMVLWNTMFNKRQDIKGNYDVMPLCQSVRLVKDVQLQQKLFVITQLSQNPTYEAMFNPYDMIRDLLRDLDVQTDNWMVSKDEWQKAMQQQQQSPENQAKIAETQLMQERARSEKAKQNKMYNDAQARAAEVANGGQGTPDNSAQEHQEFLIEKQLQVHQTNAKLAQTQTDAATKRYIADQKAVADRQKTAAALDSNIRRERTDLIKTGTQHAIKMREIATKFPTGPAAAKPSAGKFTPPKLPRYGGGKRPGY